VARPTAAPQTPDHVPFLGIDGLGVIEGKLSDDPIESQRQIIDDAGLRVSVSAARILTILPQPRILPKPARARFPGPNDLDARLEAWLTGLEKLVALGTETVLVCTGAAGEFSPEAARSAVIESLRVMAAMAEDAGTRLAVEPMREASLINATIITSLQDTLELLDDVGDDDIGIVFDVEVKGPGDPGVR
jgi:hypothetical protein